MCALPLQKKKKKYPFLQNNFSGTFLWTDQSIKKFNFTFIAGDLKKSVQSLHVERAPLSHEKQNIPAIRLFDKKYLHGVQFDQLSNRYS